MRTVLVEHAEPAGAVAEGDELLAQQRMRTGAPSRSATSSEGTPESSARA
jgi:hypothetical protein